MKNEQNWQRFLSSVSRETSWVCRRTWPTFWWCCRACLLDKRCNWRPCGRAENGCCWSCPSWCRRRLASEPHSAWLGLASEPWNFPQMKWRCRCCCILGCEPQLSPSHGLRRRDHLHQPENCSRCLTNRFYPCDSFGVHGCCGYTRPCCRSRIPWCGVWTRRELGSSW